VYLGVYKGETNKRGLDYQHIQITGKAQPHGGFRVSIGTANEKGAVDV
jgi:hypothetical protein